MAKIGNVEVMIIDESVGKFSEVTERPVESGAITDNVKKMPDTVELTGTVTADGWAVKRVLDEYHDNGTLITYTGKSAYESMVIEAFDVVYTSENKDGFNFSMSLKEVRIASLRIMSEGGIPTPAVDEGIETQVKPITNAGLQTLRDSIERVTARTEELWARLTGRVR